MDLTAKTVFFMTQVYPVILSGGSGTRLWPKSRKSFPKQLHNLYGDCTMLQHTVNRVKGFGAPIVVCNEAQRFMVADQLTEVCESKPEILLEPMGRNTAPAIACAAIKAIEKNDDSIIVVLAADHQIKDETAFNGALEVAINKAKEGKLVAFGIVPAYPETGYGYIQAKEKDLQQGSEIQKFVEKPNKETAEQYLASGDYFWNSGMFVFSAKTYLSELEKFESEMLCNCKEAIEGAKLDLDFVRLNKDAFEKAKDISIDYAVMEKTENAWVVPLDAQWSDLGSWDSLWKALDKDENGNVAQGDVILKGCKNIYVSGEHKLIAGIGVEDIAIVDTDDTLLVVHKDKSQDVKHIVDQLKKENRSEFNLHRKVHRPWGNYDSIGFGDRYQVKCIEVKPGASLSLQMHHHRAEHWIVVSGTALVQKGEEEVLLSENQSIYIPLGEKHRLTNPGKVNLQIIEVQSGSYLGEDDIVRFEDVFGRA